MTLLHSFSDKIGKITYEEAADEMPKWFFCNGKRLRGLMLRRTDERALFLANFDEGQSKLASTTLIWW